MITKIHNKLVRDKIPQFLENKNIISHFKKLNNKKYNAELKKKLLEEVNEYLQAKNKNHKLEELADIFEVILAITKNLNSNFNELENIRIKKQNERGAFEKKIFLEKTVQI